LGHAKKPEASLKHGSHTKWVLKLSLNIYLFASSPFVVATGLKKSSILVKI
jgi:hypothetical protein